MLNAEEGVLKDGIQTFPDRTDRVYLNAEACSVIHDDVLQRNIDVIHRHHGNVVAWNPGPALSVSMGDMPDDGYKTFVCVETCCVTVPQKASEEKPTRLAQTLRVVKRYSTRNTGKRKCPITVGRFFSPLPTVSFSQALARRYPVAPAHPPKALSPTRPHFVPHAVSKPLSG